MHKHGVEGGVYGRKEELNKRRAAGVKQKKKGKKV